MHCNLVLPICRRPDITKGLKRLTCRSLIFVGDSSPFHSEALHMNSKLDRRFSALVEVCGAIYVRIIYRWTSSGLRKGSMPATIVGIFSRLINLWNSLWYPSQETVLFCICRGHNKSRLPSHCLWYNAHITGCFWCNSGNMWNWIHAHGLCKRQFVLKVVLFVQVQACGSMVTEEQPHAMLIPMEFFFMGYGLYKPYHVSDSPRGPLSPSYISPELLSPESMGLKLKPIKTRVSLHV